jgi:hypothetical protein
MAKREESDATISDAVAVVQEVTGTVVGRRGDVLGKYLAANDGNLDVAPDAIHSGIIQEILGADTADDVLQVWEPEKLESFTGRRIRLLEFRMQDSDFEEGAPVYAAVKVLDVDAGTRHLITTGEQAIMAQLLRLEQLSAYPIDVIPIQASRPNRHGRYLMRLKGAGS